MVFTLECTAVSPVYTSPCVIPLVFRRCKAFKISRILISRSRVLTLALAIENQERVNSDYGSSPIIVIGAGVAGLAAASALHRVGLSSIVLEQSSNLREGGAALSLWGNGWRALEALGVSKLLRTEYSLLEKVEICSESGSILRDFTIEECVRGPHEVRGVHRSILLKTLANQLPAGCVRFNSKPASFTVDKSTGIITVELETGERLSTSVLLGCDGGRSAVGKWLQKSPPSYCGYSAFRGIASFPHGHSLGSTIRMVWGQGVRAGMYPLNSTEVYWFTCFNLDKSEVDRVRKMTGKEMQAFAAGTVKGWSFGVEEAIMKTEEEGISLSSITDRWTLPLPGTRWGNGGATLLGDAAHPMTPNLGQGACTALEDAVIVAQKLAGVSKTSRRSDGSPCRVLGDAGSIAACLEEFDRERILRTAPLTVRANAMGFALQLPSPLVCFLRDRVALPFVLKTNHFLDHALFDCGDLPAL